MNDRFLNWFGWFLTVVLIVVCICSVKNVHRFDNCALVNFECFINNSKD